MAISVLAPWLQAGYGLQIQLRPLSAVEWGLLASVPMAALLVALIPGVRTWKQSRSLGLGEVAEP
ncbi:hypothetical protein [Marinobacter similis]|uniref:hypothetical protein n=1 Tax=Marinobacter similis TaxID=1420916 RepID=UPI001F1DCB7B|nr:hypothetical protein [Marinobacter similis]